MDTVVLSHVNASTPTRLDLPTLVACLAQPGHAGAHLGQLSAFFDLPLEAIVTFAVDHGLSLAQVQAAYHAVRALSGEHSEELDDWLDYLATPAA